MTDERRHYMLGEVSRVGVIACEVFFREIAYFAAISSEVFDIVFLPKGLHDLGGQKMRETIQPEIDRMNEKDYKRIVLGYALCNNGSAGLTTRRAPLIIPKAHDCVTLFFGSRQKYKEYFFKKTGTIFHTTGWLERGDGDQPVLDGLLRQDLAEYIAKYGEENGRFLWETLNPEKNYHRIAYINLPLPGLPDLRTESMKTAHEKGWEWEEISGDSGMIRRLLNGPYSKDEFVVVNPGETVVATNDEEIIGTSKNNS